MNALELLEKTAPGLLKIEARRDGNYRKDTVLEGWWSGQLYSAYGNIKTATIYLNNYTIFLTDVLSINGVKVDQVN